MVRHGTSIAHDTGKRQSPDSPLSEKGRKQAYALGKRIKRWGVSFERVFTSKLPRANETAEIMAKILGSPVEVFEGIHEKEQHPDLYGADIASKLHGENVAAYTKYAGDLDYKFQGGGESVREVAKRASAFRDHLTKNHSGEDVLVVSHGIFIRSFVAVCVLGEDYRDISFSDLHSSITISNTGVSLMEYEEQSKKWKIVYLNNFSHLKEV